GISSTQIIDSALESLSAGPADARRTTRGVARSDRAPTASRGSRLHDPFASAAALIAGACIAWKMEIATGRGVRGALADARCLARGAWRMSRGAWCAR